MIGLNVELIGINKFKTSLSKIKTRFRQEFHVSDHGEERWKSMTELEKQEILTELEERFEKKYKGCLTREDTQSVLKKPRNKWFRDENGVGQKSLMADAFDNSIVSWQVWETIRKLTCVICGKQYVRHLLGVEESEETAEEICQFIYDLRMKYKKNNCNQSME